MQNWGGKPGSAEITEVLSTLAWQHLSKVAQTVDDAAVLMQEDLQQRSVRIQRPVPPCPQALPPFLATLLDRLEACRVFSAAERPNHCLINSYERAAPCPTHQDGPLCESPFVLPTAHTLLRSMAVVPSQTTAFCHLPTLVCMQSTIL